MSESNGSSRKNNYPFSRNYKIIYEESNEKKPTSLPKLYSDYLNKEESWRKIDHDWLRATEALALKLDNDTNNTSLVLAIELMESGKVLLFPGDAQVGNWLSWEKVEWELKDQNGDEVIVQGHDLLRRTVFYKVGHHGSHNATLREKGLELFDDPELVAMIPVSEKMVRKKGWKMPFGPLMERLQEKTMGRVFRADRKILKRKTEGFESPMTSNEWEAFKERHDVKEEDLYLEYTVF